MNARMLKAQYVSDLRQLFRNPAAVGFTIFFPLLFLFLFVGIFGTGDVKIEGGAKVDGASYFTPGIATLAIVSATFLNVAIVLTTQRESGLLKRVRSTPLPPAVFILARLLVTMTVAVSMVALLIVVGAIVFGAKVPTHTLPAVIVMVLLGSATLGVLGLAFSAAIPSEEASPPMTNLIVLPIEFISGIFVAEDAIPKSLLHVADVFPVRPTFHQLLHAYLPTTHGLGFDLGNLAVVAAWGVAGMLIAVRTFKWVPRNS